MESIDKKPSTDIVEYIKENPNLSARSTAQWAMDHFTNEQVDDAKAGLKGLSLYYQEKKMWDVAEKISDTILHLELKKRDHFRNVESKQGQVLDEGESPPYLKNRYERDCLAQVEDATHLDNVIMKIKEGSKSNIKIVTLNEIKKFHKPKAKSAEAWYPPSLIMDAVRGLLRAIDLNPLSTAEENELVQAQHFWTKDDEPLSKQWNGKVFLNFTFKADLMPITQKFLEELDSGRVEQVMILANNILESSWCQLLLKRANIVCHLTPRVQFINNDEQTALKLGQSLYGFAVDETRFRLVLDDMGVCR